MKIKPHQQLAKHFETTHNNPPKPFNAQFNPKAKGWSLTVAQSMEHDGFYDAHTRDECAIEWRKRFDALERAETAIPH